MHELILAKDIIDICLSKLDKQDNIKKIFLELGPTDHHQWSDLKSNLKFNFKFLSQGTNLEGGLLIIKENSKLGKNKWKLVKFEL